MTPDNKRRALLSLWAPLCQLSNCLCCHVLSEMNYLPERWRLRIRFNNHTICVVFRCLREVGIRLVPKGKGLQIFPPRSKKGLFVKTGAQGNWCEPDRVLSVEYQLFNINVNPLRLFDSLVNRGVIVHCSAVTKKGRYSSIVIVPGIQDKSPKMTRADPVAPEICCSFI